MTQKECDGFYYTKLMQATTICLEEIIKWRKTVSSSAASLLRNEYHEILQQKIRELGAKLFFCGVGVQKTGTDVAPWSICSQVEK